MKLLLHLSLVSLSSISLSQGAWLWNGFVGSSTPEIGPIGTSGNATLISNPDYSVDGRHWDLAPENIPFTWSTAGGEPVGFSTTNAQADGVYSSVQIELDPDGNGTLPDSLTFTALYPIEFTSRWNTTANTGGGLGFAVNPVNMTLAGELNVTLGDATQALLDNTYSFNSDSAGTQPNSFVSGNAVWDNIDGAGHWHGLDNNDNNATTYFPWATGDASGLDQSKTIGQVSWTFSNFRDLNSNGSDDTTFLLSFDGGIPTNAQAPQPIPEPTVWGLLGTLALITLTRRQR